jgi:ABC-type multidrug transport system ATPase subunit
MLRVTSLEKKLGSFSLSINELCIQKPGIYGLIGPNGCGKSTTAKLVCGVLQPDSGKIDLSLEKLAVTMITQKPYIMDDTVYNNLAYPLKLRGTKPVAPLCEENLRMIGFLERKNQRARELSGGEKQKLALLRAMIFQPRLIILDEAMTELDLDSLDFFEGMILERQKSDPIIWIIISHQLAQVRRLCDYIFFMNGGRLEAEGATEDLLHSSNPLVSRFLKHGVMEVGS